MRQLDLLARVQGTEAPAFDASFAGAVRRALPTAPDDEPAWVDHVPGWLRGHAALFAELARELPWRHERRTMYTRTVDVPRLLAQITDDGPGQPMIGELARALSARYGEAFVRLSAALYRDGADSVAWHGDTIARDLPAAMVATVSLGQPRRFLLKPTAGGAPIALRAGLGDLIVMGGSSQRTWRHAIPKVAHAAPRIALMFRPDWAAQYRP